MPTLISYFNDMDDPRGGNAPRHNFCDLMTISLLCALCGGETAVDMEYFGQMKEDFLREYLELPHGIPCHDAYSRLFRLMKPSSFQTFFDKFRADFGWCPRAWCNLFSGWVLSRSTGRRFLPDP